MLSSLAGLGLVRKELPVIDAGQRKSIYILDDWMFVFWFRFVLLDMSRILAGYGDSVCEEAFAGQIGSHVGRAFEECAKQYMWHALGAGKLPFTFRQIGRWWGNNPKERREEEIDFVAFSEEKAIFGECKWRNEAMGEDILHDLMRKAALFPRFKDIYYILFSKSGFTDALRVIADRRGDVTLVGIDDMFA
jgi:AAA+ ATPase superfamily predicted ATPase